MKLSEAIKAIPDDDWLEIREQSTNKYNSLIGRAPKKYIVGEVLDYEVEHIGTVQNKADYTLHKFIVKNKHNS
jgi:hypothetical protein